MTKRTASVEVWARLIDGVRRGGNEGIARAMTLGWTSVIVVLCDGRTREELVPPYTTPCPTSVREALAIANGDPS